MTGGVAPVVMGAADGFARSGFAGAVEGALEMATFDNISQGAMLGGIIGGAGGMAGFGAGRAIGSIKSLSMPRGLPDPRNEGGLLMRVSRPDNVRYGGLEAKEGFARHHIKPLSFGGSDTADNMRYVPDRIHSQPHGTNDIFGTLYY